MPDIVEGKGLGDLLKFEIDPNYCRKQLKVQAGESVVTGQVLGIWAASAGNYVVAAFGGTTATENDAICCGVAIADADGGSVLCVRRGATVARNELVFAAGATAAQKAEACEELEKIGISVAESA
jgi:hypothetical protein